MIILGQKESKLLDYVKDTYLELNYFEKGIDSPRIIFFPFVGNIDISENRTANYTDYQPISRNTTLFGYTGSKSREFVINYSMNVDYLFKYANLLPRITPSPSRRGEALFTPGQSSSRQGGVQYYIEQSNSQDLENKRKALEFIDYQINLVRSMPINNAEQPTQAPPIVRLNHGLLYQDIPCVCRNYSISQDSGPARDIGYKSKISNKFVTIEIMLSETRTGDYQKTSFDPNNNSSRDNIVGWEQILKGRSLDPITPIYL